MNNLTQIPGSTDISNYVYTSPVGGKKIEISIWKRTYDAQSCPVGFARFMGQNYWKAGVRLGSRNAFIWLDGNFHWPDKALEEAVYVAQGICNI